jgi:hypothetical protein
MKMTAVESSALATVGYDESNAMLQLEFRSRAVYHYFAVPAAAHEALLAATSKGGYFNRAIRGRYRFVQVDPRPTESAPNSPSPGQRGAAWPVR